MGLVSLSKAGFYSGFLLYLFLPPLSFDPQFDNNAFINLQYPLAISSPV